MTDLRTAAQAVLDACDKCVLRKEQIEALRQALADTPSVDALIAEAVAKEREACAEVAVNTHPHDFGFIPQAIRARGQK